jgi:hypothetical protein
MVATLAVTSSPVSPSPRVAARTRRPSSYSNEIASPSSLGSPTNVTGSVMTRSMRAYQAANLLAGERVGRATAIGTMCWTGANVADGGAPTS